MKIPLNLLCSPLFFCLGMFLLGSQSNSTYAQQKWYVSSNGDDANAGTLQAPLATLQQVLSLMNDGDSCFIRAGRYAESLKITGRNNLYFGAYQNEQVILDGTIVLADNWIQHSPQIYKTTLTEHIWQLFVDDKEQVMARWPNGQFDDNSIYNQSLSWATGVANQGNAQKFVVANNLLSNSNLDLTGAMAVVNIGSFKTFARQITQHSPGQDSFLFNPTPNNAFRSKDHHAFAECKLDLLDTNNEWYYDTLSKTLYVYGDKTGMEVRGKNRDYAFELNNCTNITLFDLHFFATTFKIDNSDYCTVDSCLLAFPNCSKRMLLSEGMPAVTAILNNNSKGNHIKHCLFEYTDAEALRIRGDSNIVEQCYFHHIDWSAANIDGIGASISANNAKNTQYIYNTVHFTGASEMLIPGVTPTVAWNNFYNTGKVQSDGAMIQCTRTNVQNANLHHNWLHDTKKYGLRFDAPISNPALAGKQGLVHHNVVWKTGGMMIKGDEHTIAHNTCFANTKNGIILLPDASSNLLTVTRNNAAQRMGGHRTAPPSTSNPIPGTHDHNWIGYQESSSLPSLLEDTMNRDFSPLMSSIELIDSGIILSNISHPTLGTAPDLGAYEAGGTPWVPGVNWTVDFFPWTSPGVITSQQPLLTRTIGFDIWPNPSTDFINFSTNVKHCKLQIFNNLGQLIWEKELYTHQEQIPIDNLPKGMYFLQMESSQETQSKAFIIQ